jgi:hypothetical protein
MFKKILLLFTVYGVVSTVALWAGGPEKEEAAVLSAEKWLGLVDAGNYTESWDEAAGYFKNAVKKEQWEQSLRAVRKPIGKPLSRKLKTKTSKTSLPGALDGEYMVIEFETSFEKKKSSIETVTPMMDVDGRWRVSGYYIR